jgi:hypothetical protein
VVRCWLPGLNGVVLESAVIGSCGASFGRVDLCLLIVESEIVVGENGSVGVSGGTSVRFDTVELAPAFLLVFLLVMTSKEFEVGLDEYLC